MGETSMVEGQTDIPPSKAVREGIDASGLHDTL
jgi:hypothetical protein